MTPPRPSTTTAIPRVTKAMSRPRELGGVGARASVVAEEEARGGWVGGVVGVGALGSGAGALATGGAVTGAGVGSTGSGPTWGGVVGGAAGGVLGVQPPEPWGAVCTSLGSG